LNQTKEEELIIKWKHAINFVKHDIFQLLEGGHEEDFFEEIEEIIEDDDVEEWTETFKYLREAAQNYLTGTVSSSDAGLITRRLAPCSVTALSGEVLRKFEETVAANRGLDSEMRNLLRDMRGRLLDTELEIDWKLELLIIWKDAVYTVKNDVFDGDVTYGEIDFEEIEDIIEYEEVEDFTEAFKYLKDAVQNYLTGTSSSGEVRTELDGRVPYWLELTEQILMKFHEIEAGNQGLDNELRDLLRDMRLLLSEWEQKEAGELEMFRRMNNAVNDVRNEVFGGDFNAEEEEVFEEIEAIIEDREYEDFSDPFNYLRNVTRNICINL